MTIRKTLADLSRFPRNRKIDDDEARAIKARLNAGEPIFSVHKDYPRVSRNTIKRIATGERVIR